MRLWRGQLQQVTSGENTIGFHFPKALEKDARAIPRVLEAARSAELRSRGVTWKLSLTDKSGHWVSGAIGKRTSGDAWTEEQGWMIGEASTGQATEFLVDLRTKTLLMRVDSRVANRADTIINRMEALLNETLRRDFPNSGWVFNITLERDPAVFMDKFERIRILTSFSIEMPIRNGDGAELLESLRGEAAESGGDRVTAVIASERGISKQSRIVKTALEMLGSGLARLKARGLTAPDKQGESRSLDADSQAEGKALMHHARTHESKLRLEMAENLMRDLGMISEPQDSVSD